MKKPGAQYSEDVPIESITVGARRRPLDESWVEALASIIEENRFNDPVLIAHRKDGYQLVDGAHRLAAFRFLKIVTIPAIIIEASDDEIRLMEIDSTLIRHELKALDRAVFLAERKELYEWLHPETKHGAAPKGKNKAAKMATFRFSEETAEKIGLSERAIQRAVQIAEGLHQDIRARAAAMPIAGNQSELLALAKQGPEMQAAVLDALERADDPATSVRSALAEIDGKASPKDAGDRDLTRLMDSWRRANPKARRRFLKFIGDGESG